MPTTPEVGPEPVDVHEEFDPDSKKRGRGKAVTSGAPIRTYVVFEEFLLEPNGKAATEVAYTEVHRVEARNAENAIRRAYRELAGDREGQPSATLVVVPESMWRPTPVHLNTRTTVSIG